MLERIILIGLSGALGWAAREYDLLPRLAARAAPPEALLRARATLRELNRGGRPQHGIAAFDATSGAPTIDDVARLWGAALGSAQIAHEEALNCWGRFPFNASLAERCGQIEQERRRLAAATIAAVLNSPAVGAAIQTIQAQTGNLVAAAEVMKRAATDTAALAGATDAVGAIAGLAASFGG